MNIVNRLTLRQLRLNRKRTLVTVVGVIISVAMITAVSSLGVSFFDFMRRGVESAEGAWHVRYWEVGPDALRIIQDDPASDRVLLERPLGYAALPGVEENPRPYLYLEAQSAEALQEAPFVLTEGRMPQREGEIVLSERLRQNDYGELPVGQTVELAVGLRRGDADVDGAEDDNPLWQETALLTDQNGAVTERLEPLYTQSYTVVGYMQPPPGDYTWSPGYAAVTLLEPAHITDEAPVTASVVLRHPDGGLFEHGDELAQSLGVQVSYHDELLRYMGLIGDDILRATLYSVSAVVLLIIVVGSVSLIYNAFSISVAERSRYLGMLASVGATRRQKRGSVFFEGAVIGAVSIPIGMLSGLVGIGITLHCVDPMVQRMVTGLTQEIHLRLAVSPLSLLGAVLLSVGTIFCSVWVPARRASRISPVEAIRQTSDVRLTRRAVKTWPLTRWLFGFEAELGLKNLKRNRRRYRATVFSLVVSVLLFLTVSYFIDCVRRSLDLYQNGVNYDIVANTYVVGADGTMHSADAQGLLAQAQSQELVTESARVSQTDLRVAVPPDQVGDGMESFAQSGDPGQLWEGACVYDLSLVGVDAETLAQVAQAVGVDPELLCDPERPAAVFLPTYRTREGVQFRERTALRVPDGATLPVLYRAPAEDGQAQRTLLEGGTLTFLGAYRGELPMGMSDTSYPGMVQCITSEEVVQALAAQAGDSYVRTSLYLSSRDPLGLQRVLESLQLGDMRLAVTNYYQIRQENENMVALVSVFIYGFILLVTAVCVANIFNTISTGVALRRREFAMLKSVGMAPEAFRRMIRWESLFYGVKALLYGLPLSFAVMGLIYYSLQDVFDFAFRLPWRDLLVAVVGVFLVVAAAMGYAGAKTRRDNIVETLRQESF